MTPQLTKIAECLSESHAREIKLARCLAESLKRIQTLESSAKTKDTKAKASELRFNAAVRDLAEQLAKQNAENEELIRKMEEAIKVEFPAQLVALKAEFATPAAQAAAPQSFNPRGDYEAGEKYKPFDYVSSNGSSYIALVENPTQPPSKKSKQWMLVAARGAGGGGVTGLGTAAYRDVGQAAGNLLEYSGLNAIAVGNGGAPGTFVNLLGPDGTVSVSNDSGQLTFSDASATVSLSQLALLSQVGDRYLTSSTTSNTIGNGAKTFTVGTGLAYTPTQDITIVFNASNHMHASVTSYNSATGALVVDVNHNTGSGTYAVWTVNVGGIGAGAIPSGGTTGQVLAKVSATNYDDAWVTPTVAVGGVTGLGTGVATALAVNAGSAGAFVRTTDTATTTTAGVVPGLGIDAINAPTSTNAATLAQINGLSRRTMSMLFTDFMGRLSGFQQTDGFVWGAQSGSGGSIADQASEASHPGINRLSTGATSASGFYGLDNATTNNAVYLLNDGTLYWEWCIRIPTLSDATNRFIVHVGCASANASVSTEMFSIRYSDNVNSGKFLGVCRAASSETTVDTGITVVANTWYRVGALMNANATSAQFYVDGVATGAAITTNISTNTGRLGGGIFKTVGTAARTLDVDYTYYLKTFTTAR